MKLTAQGVQKDERKEVLNYYNEMYRDKLEDGWTEREVLREIRFSGRRCRQRTRRR